MRGWLIIATATLAGCVTPKDLTDNQPALAATSTKPQSELIGCIATEWAEFQMALATIPTDEKTSITLSGLYGAEARADIFPNSRVEVRLRNTLIKGNGSIVRAAQRCI